MRCRGSTPCRHPVRGLLDHLLGLGGSVTNLTEVVAGVKDGVTVTGVHHLGEDLVHVVGNGGLAGDGAAEAVQQPEVVHERLRTGIRMIGGESSQDTGTSTDGGRQRGTYLHRRFH